ncbi:MAG: CvpA family protein [Pirellulales bacterium]
MQAYDVIMVLVVVSATILGAWKGMAWQLASLASLVVSYFVALRFGPQIAPALGDHSPWNLFLAMLVMYIATSLVIWLLFRIVADFIDRVKLKEFDHQIGGLFGVVKGILLCVAITFFAVSLLPDSQKRKVLDSRSGYYIGVLLSRTHDVVPPEIHDVLHPYLHQIQRRLDPTAPENQPKAHTAEGETEPAIDAVHGEPPAPRTATSGDEAMR